MTFTHLQTRRKARDQMRPSERVRAALIRVTRDRVVPADEVRRIALRFSELISSRPHHVSEAAAGDGWFYGMFRGQPITRRWAAGRSAVIHAQDKFKRAHQKDLTPELTVLQLQLQNQI